MNIGFIPRALAAAMLVCLALPASSQQRGDDEIARGFVRTRGTEVVGSAKRQRTKPRRRAATPIGLGYTLFKKDANGQIARVNPSQEFRGGDKLRFAIESNTAGYLYIFHQANDAPPKMIFPDARLKWGDNWIEAHVPYEAPSSREPGDWWFNFDGPAAIERFYLVIARAPLTAMWSGERLVAHCQQSPQACPPRPAEATWNQLLAQARTATRESRSKTFGETQARVERQAIWREVKLKPDNPAPSVIKINASAAASMLMATVEIVHN